MAVISALAWRARIGVSALQPRTARRCPRSTSSRRHDRRAGAADPGLTLLELIISIAILGVAGVTIVGAWQFNITASDRHRSFADVQTVLASAAEQIVAPTFVPAACEPTTSPAVPTNQAAILAEFQSQARKAQLPTSAGWAPSSIVVTNVEYWNGNDTGNIWGATCYEASGLSMRRATLVVTSPGGKSSATLEVVKTDV